MLDSGDDADHAQIALQKIDGLIELSENARQLKPNLTTRSNRQVTDVVELVEHVVNTFRSIYPTATISIEGLDTVTAPVLPTFKRALEELMESAAKHSGDTPTVTVTIEQVPNAVEVDVSDDGPGLPETEQKVLDTGVETPLHHGTGLGL